MMDVTGTVRTPYQRTHWTDKILSHRAQQWRQDKRRQLGAVSYHSPWWALLFLPRQGIPRRSSLSPFFGALYLSALDEAFSNHTGMFYLRYMDDIVILIQSRRAYQKAKKRLFSILKTLKLQIAPTKTRMGRLSRAFHFLGVQFEVPRRPQTKIQVTTTPTPSIQVHPRTCPTRLGSSEGAARRGRPSGEYTALLDAMGHLVAGGDWFDVKWD